VAVYEGVNDSTHFFELVRGTQQDRGSRPELLEDLFSEGVEVFISDHINPGEAWAQRL
jgi:hypothetical protein